MGSRKDCKIYMGTIGEGEGVSDESSSGHRGLQVNKLLQLDCQMQQNRNHIPEDELLLHYIWKDMIANPEDWKIWRQISSEGKKLIVASIPKNEPKSNRQVMMSVF